MIRFFFFLMLPFLSLLSYELQSPSKLVDFERIQFLERQYNQGTLDANQILKILDSELNQFYKQFLELRNLREEIVSIPYDFYHFPMDKIHRLIYVRNLEEIQKQKKFYSPVLLKAHFLKGRILEDQKQYNQAFLSYLQSLYFSLPILEELPSRKIEIPEQIEFKELDKVVRNTQIQSFFDYLSYIQSVFGNSNYLEETLDISEKERIQNIINLTGNLKSELEQIEKIKKDYYLFEFQREIQRRDSKKNEFHEKWNQIHNLFQRLMQQKEEFIDTVLRNKKKQYSEVLFRMANLMKILEENHKERERLLNQSSFYRGRGNELGINKTLLRDFVGYKTLLEMAHQLEPENLEYLDNLSEQYFQDKQIERGIYIEKQWIQYAPENHEKNPAHYLRLISYYVQIQNYSLANSFLEKLYNLLNQYPELQNKIYKNSQNLVLGPYENFLFYYADFRLQNFYIKEKQIFQNLLNKIKEKQIQKQNENEVYELIRLEYLTLRNLARIAREEKNYNEEMQNLQQIQNLFFEVDKQSKQLQQEIENSKKMVQNLKKELYIKDDSEKAYQLNEIQKIQIPNLENQYQIYNSLKNTIAMASATERIAFLYFLSRKYSESIENYVLLLQFQYANPDQKKRAERNITNLQNYLKTGFLKKIEVPDDFER